MLRKVVFLFVLLNSYPLLAQNAFSGFRMGLGFYSMKDLDQLQELRREATGLPLETTESYAASLTYHFEIGKYLPFFISKWAICYEYGSTGARSTLSDYSGRYDLDAVITNYHFGLSLEHVITIDKHWGYGAYIETGYIHSKLKTLDFFNLTYPAKVSYKIAYDFVASGGYGEGGLILQYKYRFLMARLNFGYFFDIQAGFHLKDDVDMQLHLDNKKLCPQWDGLRMGLQVNILLGTSRKTD